MKEAILTLFQRDLKVLLKEIEQYPDENLIWQTVKGTSNSGGNLALHLVGNLKTYIGKNLGNIDYLRNRELEFSAKNIPRQEVLQAISETFEAVTITLTQLSQEEFSNTYPENVLGYEMSTEYFLIHLHGHLTYHLGQINYHRRISSEMS
ncbi:DinB family protein [Arcicella rosea]|uniref:Putative damage-inducible protein DinB n=1 Tax=Arcicella rosea TaxID=502909 RepID=A0A841ETG1_9BACT|nr:DinB family protein [Arcicella rosea]MBB6004689.1 putative damage-inducible protein DinB [Arcicella rosea]